MAEVEMKWYVLRAVSGKEAKVKEYIDAEIKNGRLGGFVSQVFIPTEKVITTQGNKRVVKEGLSMPGYILVEAKLVGEIAHELRSTPNCLGFLGGMENPVPLRDSEVNRILAQAEDPEEGVEVMVPFVLGDGVKVMDGPFKGFSGQVESIDEEKQQVSVSVKVFGRPQPITLGFMDVEKE